MFENSLKIQKLATTAGVAAVIGTSLFAAPSLAASGKAHVYAKLNIGFLGVNVGRMRSSIVVKGDTYTFAGDVKSNRFVSVFADTTANFMSTGSIGKKSVVPNGHSLKYRAKKKKGALNINFRSGNIKSHSSFPAVKYKPGTTPLKKKHLKRVVDPLSSLIFAVDDKNIENGAGICNRTIPVFDGRRRYDLKMRYKSSRKQRAEGFNGKTFTCAVRYKPIAGIQMNKKDVKFMKNNRNIEVTMARVADSNVYALFGFRVATGKGMATGQAYTFQTR